MKCLSLPQAAKHVGLSVSTVRRLIVQEGKFPKPGRHGDPETGKYAFAVADLDAWLAKIARITSRGILPKRRARSICTIFWRRTPRLMRPSSRPSQTAGSRMA